MMLRVSPCVMPNRRCAELISRSETSFWLQDFLALGWKQEKKGENNDRHFESLNPRHHDCSENAQVCRFFKTNATAFVCVTRIALSLMRGLARSPLAKP